MFLKFERLKFYLSGISMPQTQKGFYVSSKKVKLQVVNTLKLHKLWPK